MRTGATANRGNLYGIHVIGKGNYETVDDKNAII